VAAIAYEGAPTTSADSVVNGGRITAEAESSREIPQTHYPALEPWIGLIKSHLTKQERNDFSASLYHKRRLGAEADLGESLPRDEDLENFAQAVVDLNNNDKGVSRKQALNQVFDGMLSAMMRSKPIEDTKETKRLQDRVLSLENALKRAKAARKSSSNRIMALSFETEAIPDAAPPSLADTKAKAINLKSPFSSCKDFPDNYPWFVNRKTGCAKWKKLGYCGIDLRMRGGGWNRGKNLYGFNMNYEFLVTSAKFNTVRRPTLKQVKLGSRVAQFCPKTCGFCSSRCVRQCQDLLQGICRRRKSNRQCGRDWTCPSWRHPTVTCRQLRLQNVNNRCSQLCHSSDTQQVITSRFASSKLSEARGKNTAMTTLKHLKIMGSRTLRKYKNGRRIKAVYFADAIKMVHCMLDKSLKQRCMMKKVLNVELACLADTAAEKFRRKNNGDIDNRDGVMWYGAYTLRNAERQPLCCARGAKRCGSKWLKYFKKLKKQGRSPAPLSPFALTALAPEKVALL